MAIRKRSIKISGHATSVSLEEEFWIMLQNIAAQKDISVNTLIAEIDDQSAGNLSSAIRVYILKYMQNQKG